MARCASTWRRTCGRAGAFPDGIIGSVPFVFALSAMIVIPSLFPKLALWMPQTAMR